MKALGFPLGIILVGSIVGLAGCDEYVYVGSDSKYHYFDDGDQSYRILRQNLDVEEETPLEKVRAGKTWDGRKVSRDELEKRVLERVIERFDE